jgi:multidrug efflux system membrane fusion protein
MSAHFSARPFPPQSLRLIIIGGMVMGLAACGEQSTPAPELIRPVKAIRVEATAPTETVSLLGIVKAHNEATLSFRVPGKIVARTVNIGDRVEPGQALASLDIGDADIALRNAEVAVASAQSLRDNAQKSLDRYQALLLKGVVPQDALDGRQSALDQANAALASATSNRDQARNQLAYSTLTADAEGIVTQVSAQPGQVVAAGTPVLVVAEDGDKEVDVAVPENQIAHLSVGDKLPITFWSDVSAKLEGTVREISGSADPASRTFDVRVALPPGAAVRLGMTATIAMPMPAATNGLVVPVAAVAQQNGKPVVWVVDPSTQTVSARAVELASFVGDNVRVSGGVVPGDLVVAAGTQFMRPNEQVHVLAEDGASRPEEEAL